MIRPDGPHHDDVAASGTTQLVRLFLEVRLSGAAPSLIRLLDERLPLRRDHQGSDDMRQHQACGHPVGEIRSHLRGSGRGLAEVGRGQDARDLKTTIGSGGVRSARERDGQHRHMGSSQQTLRCRSEQPFANPAEPYVPHDDQLGPLGSRGFEDALRRIANPDLRDRLCRCAIGGGPGRGDEFAQCRLGFPCREIATEPDSGGFGQQRFDDAEYPSGGYGSVRPMLRPIAGHASTESEKSTALRIESSI